MLFDKEDIAKMRGDDEPDVKEAAAEDDDDDVVAVGLTPFVKRPGLRLPAHADQIFSHALYVFSELLVNDRLGVADAGQVQNDLATCKATPVEHLRFWPQQKREGNEDDMLCGDKLDLLCVGLEVRAAPPLERVLPQTGVWGGRQLIHEHALSAVVMEAWRKDKEASSLSLRVLYKHEQLWRLFHPSAFDVLASHTAREGRDDIETHVGEVLRALQWGKDVNAIVALGDVVGFGLECPEGKEKLAKALMTKIAKPVQKMVPLLAKAHAWIRDGKDATGFNPPDVISFVMNLGFTFYFHDCTTVDGAPSPFPPPPQRSLGIERFGAKRCLRSRRRP